MDDDEGDLRNVKLVFPQNGNIENYSLEDFCDKKTIYVGEAVESAIIVSCPNESKQDDWKRRITQLAGHCCFGQISKKNDASAECTDSGTCASFFPCSISSTYNTAIFNEQPQSAQPSSSLIVKPYFFNDNTFILPLTTVLNNLVAPCTDQRVMFSVTVWLCASPARPSPEQEAKRDFQLNNSAIALKGKTVQQTTVSKELLVINPPALGMKHVSAGGKQLIVLQVHNDTEKPLLVHKCSVLPNKKEDKHDSTDSDTTDNENPFSKDGGCGFISPFLTDSMSFPVSVLSQEKVSLLFTLSTDDVDSDVMEMDLLLRAFLKWSHMDGAGEKPEIITAFNLPKVRVRRGLFTVSISCDDEPKVGESFSLTYNIVNKLQDFLSMKLYWNVDVQLATIRDRDEHDLKRKQLEDLKNSVVCHDPDVYVGACPRGCTTPVSVSFQLLKPGLYEFGEMMKVNLRYALPESQSTLKQDSVGTPVSIDTPSTLSVEDQLAASEELWRDRSGSTSSLQTLTNGHSAEERRRTFATKSYSFGDLGPTLSSDSDEAQRIKFKTMKRSSAVPPPRTLPPRILTHVDRDISHPGNFLKKNFEIYIP